MLTSVEYLNNLPSILIEELIYSFNITYLDPGEYLFRPGDELDTIHFIA